ncbi:hypothetical protein BGZ63DRAFT_157700 [Mariannaea sp. PMI_226]|nr:hypothetical protein BGZ63DRAFT_157700 [Mariannaea sp. PMI_226]
MEALGDYGDFMTEFNLATEKLLDILGFLRTHTSSDSVRFYGADDDGALSEYKHQKIRWLHEMHQLVEHQYSTWRRIVEEMYAKSTAEEALLYLSASNASISNVTQTPTTEHSPAQLRSVSKEKGPTSNPKREMDTAACSQKQRTQVSSSTSTPATPMSEVDGKRTFATEASEMECRQYRFIDCTRQAAYSRKESERYLGEVAAAREEAATKDETARQEAGRLEAARREEAALQEAIIKEVEQQEAARIEAARQEAERQEAERQQALLQEASRRETARQEAARKEETEKLEAARQDAALQEAARKSSHLNQVNRRGGPPPPELGRKRFRTGKAKRIVVDTGPEAMRLMELLNIEEAPDTTQLTDTCKLLLKMMQSRLAMLQIQQLGIDYSINGACLQPDRVVESQLSADERLVSELWRLKAAKEMSLTLQYRVRRWFLQVFRHTEFRRPADLKRSVGWEIKRLGSICGISQEEFSDEMTKGKKLDLLCGGHVGLLVMIPLGMVGSWEVLGIPVKHAEAVNSVLEQSPWARVMCSVGRALDAVLSGQGAASPELKDILTAAPDISRLPSASLRKLLQPYCVTPCECQLLSRQAEL